MNMQTKSVMKLVPRRTTSDFEEVRITMPLLPWEKGNQAAGPAAPAVPLQEEMPSPEVLWDIIKEKAQEGPTTILEFQKAFSNMGYRLREAMMRKKLDAFETQGLLVSSRVTVDSHMKRRWQLQE